MSTRSKTFRIFFSWKTLPEISSNCWIDDSRWHRRSNFWRAARERSTSCSGRTLKSKIQILADVTGDILTFVDFGHFRRTHLFVEWFHVWLGGSCFPFLSGNPTGSFPPVPTRAYEFCRTFPSVQNSPKGKRAAVDALCSVLCRSVLLISLSFYPSLLGWRPSPVGWLFFIANCGFSRTVVLESGVRINLMWHMCFFDQLF